MNDNTDDNIDDNIEIGDDDCADNGDANREYKDSVFTLLFGTPEAAAEVYGAIIGEYIDPAKVKLTKLKKVLSKGRYNDLAFVVDGKLIVLIEHQSTVNKNMPLRGLMYISEEYNRWVKDDDIYSQKMVPLPWPEFYVLYNGTDPMPDEQTLKLSDAFIKDGRDGQDGQDGAPNLELIVKVYNINEGRNPEMAKRSPMLYGYEKFVAKIREYEKTMSLAEAIRKAVEYCIEQNILTDFLNIHKKEVFNMLRGEWKLEKAIEVAKRETWEIATERERERMARSMIAKGIDVDTIAETTRLTVDDVLRLMSE